MTSLVSIALFSVGFLGICAFTQLVVDHLLSYVCRHLKLMEEGSNEL